MEEQGANVFGMRTRVYVQEQQSRHVLTGMPPGGLRPVVVWASCADRGKEVRGLRKGVSPPGDREVQGEHELVCQAGGVLLGL